MKHAMVILWPSFLVAGVAEGLFFSAFDPDELHLFGSPLALSELGVYTLGFFCFWLLGAASSGLSCLLQAQTRGHDR